MEVPLPMTGKTLVKEVITAPSVIPLDVEKEPPSGSVTKEVGQPMQGVQPILPSVPLAAHDPKASRLLFPKIPSQCRLLILPKLCYLASYD